jgi:hypothetical protein
VCFESDVKIGIELAASALCDISLLDVGCEGIIEYE